MMIGHVTLEYKGHHLYATFIMSGPSLTIPMPDKWQGFIDNKPFGFFPAKTGETEDEVKQRLCEAADAFLERGEK